MAGSAMSRTITTNLFNQITNQINDDPLLLIIRVFESPDTVYLVNNTEDITSNLQVYQAFPVKVTLADDDGDSQAQVQVEFDNVSLELLDEIRSIITPIPCEIDLVLASDPDTIEIALRDLLIRDITYNAQTIKGTLTADDFLNSRFPADTYTPTDYPGIFS
jgi:hypothetical protein